MRFTPEVLLVAVTSLVTGVAGASQCAHDKCFNAVSNKPPKSSGCKAFLATTVTPPVVTVTIQPNSNTITHSTNACPTPTKSTPSKVPAYASAACKNVGAYTSACSCLGARASTKLLKACTTTVVASSTISTKTKSASKSVSTSKTIKTTAKPTSSKASSTSTAAPTSLAPPTPDCFNKGIDWAYFYNPYPYNATPPGWLNYDPAFTNNAGAYYDSTINSIQNFSYPANVTSAAIYGQDQASTQNFVLNHQVYIWAPKNGTYTFKVSGVNNVFNLWLGDNAGGGTDASWNRANALMDVYPSGTVDGAEGTGSGEYKTSLTAGTWTALRYTIAQATGSTGMDFHILDPDGVDLFAPGSDSDGLIQYGCGADGPYNFYPFGYNAEKEGLNCDTDSGCLDYYGNCISPGCNKPDGTCVPLGQDGCNNTNACESNQGCIDENQNCIAPGCYQGGNGTCVPLGQDGCNTPVGCTEPDCGG